MEAADDLGHLLSRIGGSKVITVGDRAVFEEADIPAEEYALVRGRYPHQFGIIPITLMKSVQAQEPKETRQST